MSISRMRRVQLVPSCKPHPLVGGVIDEARASLLNLARSRCILCKPYILCLNISKYHNGSACFCYLLEGNEVTIRLQ
jgi:hypothetical protein